MDSIKTVFTPAARTRLELRTTPGRAWQDRELARQILWTLSGRCTVRDMDRFEFRRAVHAAWETYLDAGFAGGLFEGVAGQDRLQRMRSGDPYQVWGGMAECLAYWYFAGRLGLRIKPVGLKAQRSPDFQLELPGGKTVMVEVKAPVLLSRDGGGWVEAFSGAVLERMRDAVGQFSRGDANLLVCVPRFSVPIWTSRKSAVAVFYAQSVLRAYINQETGAAIDKPKAAVSYAGAFLKRYPPSGDRRFKRIGAVMTIEEDGETRQSRILPRCSVIHRVVVMHNPHAVVPIPSGVWGTRAELIHSEKKLRWADGASVL